MKRLSLFLIALVMILVSCKPNIENPTVVTKSVKDITETSAKVVGQVAADGGAEVTERGICWSADGTPTIIDFRTVDGTGVGSFISNLSDLEPQTTYYVRAYATNEAGTGYGEEKTFTTLGDEPEEPGDGDGDESEDPEQSGDEPEEPYYKHYFKIGEDIYEIASGVIINNGETEGGFNLDLRLYDETGSNLLSFNIVSPQAESIPSSTYSKFKGAWVLGYTENGSYSNRTDINNGTIVINRSSDGYTIDINCIDQYSTIIEGYYKGNLSIVDEDNLVHIIPDYILPNEIYDEVTNHLPIYSGVTPPNISGEYVSSPHALIYESYGEKTDSLQFCTDRYLGFLYANKQMNFYGKQYDSNENRFIEEIQYGVKITGNNDFFTCYYVVDAYVEGYYAQQSFIFSGKKTPEGIEDFHTVVILLENSGHPNMLPVNSYRVLDRKSVV